MGFIRNKVRKESIETLTPGNARNAPTLKNAVEQMNAGHVSSRLTALANPVPEPVGNISHQLIPGPGGDILTRVYTEVVTTSEKGFYT